MAELVVVIPFLSSFWVLDDCIKSFGDSSVPVLIVDNSKDREAATAEWPDNVEVHDNGGINKGIAAGWNNGLDKGADQTLVMSQTVRLAPAELNRREEPWGLDFLAEGIKKHASEYGLTFGDQGFHLMSIGRKTVEKIGRFDENFYAYGEDDDYGHRMNMAKIHFPDWGDYKETGVHSIAFSIQKKIPSAVEIMQSGQSRIKEYYDFKWGAPHPGTYDHPFNDHTKGLDFWPEVR